MRVLVLGLGNRLFGDDALGSCAADMIRGSDNIVVKDGSVGSSNLVFYLSGFDVVVFVDVSKDLEADFVLEELEASERVDLEPHKSDPKTILSAAKALGVFEGKAYILKIKAERLCFPCKPSKEGLERLEKAVDALIKFLKKYGNAEKVRSASSSCTSNLA